jgi:hypothetical protein
MSISSYIICQQRCNPNHQLSLKQSTKLQSKLPVIIETVNQITIQITSTEICTVQILATVSYIQRRYWSVIIQQGPYRFVFSRRNINIDYIYINPDLL